MEEQDDSLNSDTSEGVSGPVLTFDRRIDMEATNRLINSLSNNREVENGLNSMDQHNFIENDSEPLDQRYLMNIQTDNFTSAQQTDFGDDFHRPGEGFNVEDEMMIREVKSYQSDQLFQETDTSALHSRNTYTRSGPEGSPAFQKASSGFLPMDNESVVFRPVKTLDFSALDETAATDEALPHGMNRSVSTPEKRHVPFIQEREICGSLGDDEQSRETSPSNEFFELKKSPTQSTECEEELNSQVIFSPLKDFEHFQNDSLETGRISRSPPSDPSPQLHTNGSSLLSPSQRVNYIPFSNYQTNDKQSYTGSPMRNTGSPIHNTGSPIRNSGSSGFLPSSISPHHQNLHSEMETGRCTPPQSPAHSLSPSARQGHQHLIKSSPGKYDNTLSGKYGVSFQRKEVLVSIPQMSRDVVKEMGPNSETFKRPEMIGLSHNFSNDSGITEQTGTHSGVRYSQMSDSDRDEFMLSDRAGQEQSTGLPNGSAWEIPSSDDSRSQPKNLNREQKLKSKQLGERKPFVSAVRNAPKPVHMNKPQKTAKGDNAVSRDNQQIQNQRNKVPGAENRQVTAPYNRNARMEGQGSQRSEGQGSQRVCNRTNAEERDRKVVSGHMRQTNSITSKRDKPNVDVRNAKPDATTQNKNSPRNHGYFQGDRMLNQREETQGEASEGQRSLHVGENTSPKHPGLNVITQVQHYGPLDMEDYLYKNNGFDMTRPDRSLDVQGMEDVRSQLQNMLKMSFDADKDPYNTHTDQVLDLDNLPQNPQNLHLNQITDYSAFSERSQDDVSDLMENFPSFTSRMWTESANAVRSEGSLNTENQRLREAIEKERYRRKHCEHHIQRLNVKLLETQQQLAVAVSTDKRKDIMIEQLDKQLAKVVEGWKKRDNEKEEFISELRKGKMQAEEKFLKQKEMIEQFEKDMADTVESLRKEKENSELTIDKLKTEIMEKERQRVHAQELLEAEKERTRLMSQEWDNIHENREHMEKKLQQLQDRLHSEQDDWFKREQELIHKIDEVNENNQKILQEERSKSEELMNLTKELEEKYTATQMESKRLEMELDASNREKESLKVEMGIMEAKFESNHRMLEADLHSQMEKEIAAQIADVHKRMEQTEDELRENHRHQISEINQRNKRDLEKQLAKFHEELKAKDEENRKQCQEYEERLQTIRKEVSSFKSAKQKLESQRYEILTKFQYMMQSQWNEAVSLLVSTPQRQNMKSFTPQDGNTENKSGVSFRIPNQSSASYQISSPGKESIQSTEQGNIGQANPAREVTTEPLELNPLPSEEINIGDFNASLHMQQFLQSLTHPIMFPVAQPPNLATGEEHKVINPQMNSHGARYQSHQDTSASLPDDGQVFHQQEPSNVHNHSLPLTSELTNHGMPNWSLDQPERILLNHLGQQSLPAEAHHNHSLPISSERAHLLPADQRTSASNQNVESWLHNSLGHGHTSLNTSGQSIDGWFPHQPVPHAAVAIRPPQQHGSVDYESLSRRQGFNSTNQEAQVSQRLVYSPPTKQTRSQASEEHSRQQDESADDSVGEISAVLDETMKLNAEYNQIEEKFDKHEYRQSELQHYIQMLLQKPPGSVVGDSVNDIQIDENASMFSHDQTEDLDLNDTAQAAQMQKEFQRIQQLREKQSVMMKKTTDESSRQTTGNQDHTNANPLMPGVLPAEQLADISRLLGQYREHWETNPNHQQKDGEHIMELVAMLKNMQQSRSDASRQQHTPEGKRAPVSRISPRSPKNKEIAKVKRNLKGQLSMMPDNPQQREISGDRGPSAKVQGQSQPKKVERKVAAQGAAGKGSNKSKSAWK